jgi:hypothetical protein
VAQEELDLLEFATRQVTQPRTRAATASFTVADSVTDLSLCGVCRDLALIVPESWEPP